MFVYNPKTPFWQRLSFFIGQAGHVDPVVLRELGMKYGVTGFCIKVADGLAPANNVELTSASWVDRLRGPQQLPLTAWGYGTADDGGDQAVHHVTRTRQLTPPTGNGNRLFLLNPEIHWRMADPDAEYWQVFRAIAPTMMAGICPEGSTWGPVEGIDYEAVNQADARSVVQTYDGDMNNYDLFKVWKAACQANYQSYTRLMFGCSNAVKRTGDEWYNAIEMFEADRKTAGMVRPLGAMIYLGETVTEDELAGISHAMFEFGLAKT